MVFAYLCWREIGLGPEIEHGQKVVPMSIATSVVRRKLLPIIPIALAFLAFVVLYSLGSNGGGGEDEMPEVSPGAMNVRVRTAPAENGEIPITVKAVGVLVPRMQSPAQVVSLIPGIVSAVQVCEGQTVETGTVIIRLDPRKSQSAVAKAEAGLRGAESGLQKAVQGGLDMEQSDLDLAAQQARVAAQQARLEADRQKALLADRLASEKAAFDAQKNLEEAERRAKAAQEKAEVFRTVGRSMELAQLEAAVEQAKAELAAAQLDRAAVEIRAPQSGRVSGLNVNVGSAVDDKTVLAQVVNGRTAVVRFWLSPADAQDIQEGAPVSIRSGTAPEPVLGRIISVGAELDSETGLVPIEAQWDAGQPGPGHIGQTVMGEITAGSSVKGIVVPVSALVIEDDKASLFTVDDQQIAHAVPVQILARTADRAAVSAPGLRAGTRVIAEGSYNLPDGTHVVEGPSR
jgi:multidrug efflux pump subunit AcrA (membrane-fusion protein)